MSRDVNGYDKDWMDAFSNSYPLQIVLIRTLNLPDTNYLTCTLLLSVVFVG